MGKIYDEKTLRDLIRKTLQAINKWSVDSEEQVIGTIAHESTMGRDRHQIGGGPALGIAQMEPETHEDCWDNYLIYHPGLSEAILKASSIGVRPSVQALINNDPYAICMCRVKYLRDKGLIPPAEDQEAQAQYWYRVYNGGKDESVVEKYKFNYVKYILGA